MAPKRSYKPKGACCCVLFQISPRILRFVGSDPDGVTLDKCSSSEWFYFPLRKKGTRTVLSLLEAQVT